MIYSPLRLDFHNFIEAWFFLQKNMTGLDFTAILRRAPSKNLYSTILTKFEFSLSKICYISTRLFDTLCFIHLIFF